MSAATARSCFLLSFAPANWRGVWRGFEALPLVVVVWSNLTQRHGRKVTLLASVAASKPRAFGICLGGVPTLGQQVAGVRQCPFGVLLTVAAVSIMHDLSLSKATRLGRLGGVLSTAYCQTGFVSQSGFAYPRTCAMPSSPMVRPLTNSPFGASLMIVPSWCMAF